MKKQQSSFAQRIVALLGSSGFFWVVVALLALQAAWIALSSAYPMAFDEEFHLGVIRLYAEHGSPFWVAHPAGADAFGAVTRDASYLYHYLMSFPYQLISNITDNLTAQVLLLRAMNIAFFAGFLVFARRLLLKIGASRAIVHLALLLFVLIPVVPLLAAQINYDNFWMPLVAFILLLVLRFDETLRRERLNVPLLIGIITLCLLASLVKYAFLPIFIAIVLFLMVQLARTFRSWHAIWKNFKTGLTALKTRRNIALLCLLLVASVLFVERFGVNMVRYHNPIPDCGKVLTVKQCSAYGPWGRDYKLELHKDGTSDGPVYYAAEWAKGMWRRLFFALAGPTVGYQTKAPFPIPSAAGQVFVGLSTVLIIIYRKRIWRRYNRPVLALLGLVTLCYVAVLWLDGYEMYVRTGKPVAINGRYLLPILPFLIVLGSLAAKELVLQRTRLKLGLATVAVAVMLCGGGALTYILRSNDSWYWPSPAVRSANHAVQRIIGPAIPGYERPAPPTAL